MKPCLHINVLFPSTLAKSVFILSIGMLPWIWTLGMICIFCIIELLKVLMETGQSLRLACRGGVDKCLNMYILHIIYTTYSMKFLMFSTKLVQNYILSFTMGSNCILGPKKHILTQFLVNRAKI